MGSDDKPHFLTGRVSSPRVIDGVLTGFTPRGEDDGGDPHSYEIRALLRMKAEVAAEAAKENILQQQRLQHERELADVQIEAEKEKAAIRAAGRPRRPKRLTHKEPNKRETVIISAIQRKYRGPAYCKYLDDSKLPTWPGAPKTHVLAYKQDKWRKKIQQERWLVRVTYSHLLSRES